MLINSNSLERFALGTAQLGLEYGRVNKAGKPSKEDAIAIIKEALVCGIAQFDTARVYGNAEEIIGEGLRSSGSVDTCVITKLPMILATSTRECRTLIRRYVDQSCEALGKNKIDVLLLHEWENRFSHNEDIWRELLLLKNQGLITTLGASVYRPEDATAALLDEEIELIQLPFNLLDKRWYSEPFKSALTRRRDVVIHARSVLLQGILQAEAESWPIIEGIDTAQTASVLRFLVKELKRENLIDLCFAYVAGTAWVNALVIGVETKDQLVENVRLLSNQPLSADEIEFVKKSIGAIHETLINPSAWV